MIEGIVRWATGAMEQGGLLALVVVMMVENLFPPIPSEAVLPLAGVLVSQGSYALPAALGAATLGAVLGAWVIYGLGRFGGRPLVYRFRHVLRFDEGELDRADAWFDRYGGWIVFGARMVPLVRSAVSVPAGASEMPFWRFTLLTAAGSGVWNALLIGAGVALGNRDDELLPWLDRFSWVVAVVLAVAVVWWVVRRVRSRSR